MFPRPLQQRLLFYFILAIFCCIMPFIVTILLVIITEDRESGMSSALMLSVMLVHFIFSGIFLQTTRLVKFITSILTTLFAIIGLKYLLPLEIIHHLFDIYGFWDIVIIHLVIAIIIWEIAYQLLIKFLRHF